MGLLNIGASALNAANLQIQTTGNNIANANTVGYHRQSAVQSEVGTLTAGGYVGMGVQIDTIKRQYDQFLERALSLGQASAASDAARNSQMSSLDGIFADSDNSIGASMNNLRSALADLVNSPSDASARTVVLSRAQALAGRISGVNQQLSDLATDTMQRVGSDVASLNGVLSQLADVNAQISKVAGSPHSPNDLLDRRDLLINQANQYMQGNAYINPDGTASLFTLTGEPMVLGAQASTFSVGTDAFGSGVPQITMKSVNGSLKLDAGGLGGGSLTGLIRFYADDLRSAQTRLGQMAAAVGDAFNKVQAGGVDGTGAAGQPMFSWPPPSVAAASGNTPGSMLGASIVDASQLAPSDYLVSYDGSQYTVIRQSDGQKTTAGSLPQTIDGLSITVASGSPQAGDQFMVRSGSVYATGFKVDLTSGAQLAAGMAVLPQAASTNAGTLAVGGFSVSDPANGNLTQPVTLTFNGSGGFDVSGGGTGNPTSVPYVAGQPISYNGWTLSLSGNPAAGDTITLGANASPGTDNRNARALFDAVDGLSVGGKTFNDAYADLVADVGTRAQQAGAASSQSSMLLDNAKAAREGVSGVNLDEEAARLLQYQQAYQAAAKLISTAQSLFASLLDAFH